MRPAAGNPKSEYPTTVIPTYSEGSSRYLRSTYSENVPVGSALADAFAGPLFSKPGSNHATLERVRQGGPYENAAFILRGCGAAAWRLRMTVMWVHSRYD